MKVNAGKSKVIAMNGEEGWSMRFTKMGFV